MRINLNQLKKYIVETESGARLGKIFDVVLDIDAHAVAQYAVRHFFFSLKEYLISPNQIVRFEENKMIVQDTVAKVGAEKERRQVVPKAEPVMMREEIGN